MYFKHSKIIVCLVFVLVLLLCGCKNKNNVQQTDLKTFSYEDDLAYFEQHGAQFAGFVNVKPQKVKNVEQAIELAKKEVTVEYNALNYAYDADAGVYRVCFYTKDWIGGNQDVYISDTGLTQFIAYGE